MRYILTLVSLILIASPAAAKDADKTQRLFGRYTCSRVVPCNSADLTATEWVQEGRACLAKGFGFRNTKDTFDDLYGLNMEGCLTPNESSAAKEGTQNLTPMCCLVRLASEKCVIQCSLVQ